MVWGERGAWGPWRGERGTGCLTAHSSRLPAPAVGAKPDWILNWKINLDSCELQLLSSPLRQGPSCPYLPPAPAASPLLQMGKLRHSAPPCYGAVMLLGQPRALPCPLR